MTGDQLQYREEAVTLAEALSAPCPGSWTVADSPCLPPRTGGWNEEFHYSIMCNKAEETSPIEGEEKSMGNV